MNNTNNNAGNGAERKDTTMQTPTPTMRWFIREQAQWIGLDEPKIDLNEIDGIASIEFEVSTDHALGEIRSMFHYPDGLECNCRQCLSGYDCCGNWIPTKVRIVERTDIETFRKTYNVRQTFSQNV